MATKRCLPTRFFKDPDIMNVGKDVQLILVGLVLLADDEGRELAHPKLLSREIDYPPEQIELALQELADNDLLLLYQAGRHRYYSLTRWNQWQTISIQKMTPSKYPAPPDGAETLATTMMAVPTVDVTPPGGNESDERPSSLSENSSQDRPEIPRISQGKDGESWESQTQFKLSESKSSKCKRIEDVGNAQPPPNVVPFPAARIDDVVSESLVSEQSLTQATKQVAIILKIPASDSLQRVVADYLSDHSVSLLGEADAAREWIEDPKRNHKQQPLTPAFFRRWLKREHDTVLRGFAPPGAAVAETPGKSRPHDAQTRAVANGAGLATVTTSAKAENPYQAFVQERAQAALRRVQLQREEGSS